MKYYILFPGQEKGSINYDKQIAADSGMSTVYLMQPFRNILAGLEDLGEEGFAEEFCNPDKIIIFNEQGKEWDIEKFVDMIYNEYSFVKNDY